MTFFPVSIPFAICKHYMNIFFVMSNFLQIDFVIEMMKRHDNKSLLGNSLPLIRYGMAGGLMQGCLDFTPGPRMSNRSACFSLLAVLVRLFFQPTHHSLAS